MLEPHVFYYRWYAVNNNVDAWQVEVTTNGGSSWTLIDTTVDNENEWKAIDVDLTAIAGGSSTVQFRFTAEDPDPGQIVEGALDDFAIYDAASGAVGVAVPPRASALPLCRHC